MLTRLSILALLCGSHPLVAQTGSFPWKAGDPAPAIAGVHLGDSRTRLDSLLGRPDSTQATAQGAVNVIYGAKGLSITYTPHDGVALIYLLRPEAGDIGGIRLGATQADVVAQWGEPPRGEGATAFYLAGTWAAIVGLDEQGAAVIQLGLGRLAGAE